MQFFAVLAAAALVVVSADNCNLSVLAPLVLSSSATKCTAASGLSFLPPSLPTAAQVPKLCASSDCRAFLTLLKAAQPTECTVNISNPPLELYKQLITPLETACGPPPPTRQ